MQKKYSRILERGVSQVLPDAESLAKKMETGTIKVYLGIDATGSLLHIGHAVVLRKLQQFVEAGQKVILLVGNATAKIGDPTGRDSTRPELTDEQIKANFENWQAQAAKILDFDKIEIRHNGDWLDKLNFQDLIKLLATTTVQQLMERDMFQERLKKGLPIFGHEIIYPLMQGYDSVAMDVDLEIGGSDQTFNMLMGRNLQKAYHDKEKWILTTPIINGLDGRKMSKSYGNFIALTAPAREMYAKLMSATDENIFPYLEVLSDLPEEEIEKLKERMAAGENPLTAKKIMAEAITGQYYSTEEVEAAADFFRKTVQEKQLPDEIPTVISPKAKGTVLELTRLCQPEKSSGELKRLIAQGGVEDMTKKETLVEIDREINLEQKGEFILRVGKRNFYRVKFE